jgi:hypothetical protein
MGKAFRHNEEVEMEITPNEKEMLHRITDNRYSGGGYKRATWIEMICRTEADRAVLDALCSKGLAEIGLGGTVAGDPYDACWLTPKGKAACE